MPTAYLSPSQLQDLTNVSSTAPSSGDNGKALVWNNTAGKWQAEQVAYSNLSGAPALPIPVADGGTGTQTGSITGTGALTFAAGGTNQNIAINPTGTGSLTSTGRGFTLNTSPSTDSLSTDGFIININNTDSFFRSSIRYDSPLTYTSPYFYARAAGYSQSLGIVGAEADGIASSGTEHPNGILFFSVFNNPGSGRAGLTRRAIVFANWDLTFLTFQGNGEARFFSATESTLTTNGAVRIDGGVGIAKNLNVGGTIKGLGAVESGAPASATAAGTAGQIRWDEGHIYVCTATNTWKRVAISTW